MRPMGFTRGRMGRRLWRSGWFLGLVGLITSLVLSCAAPSLQADQVASSATSNGAIATSPPQAVIGTNLSGVADWSTQLPFLDAFKSARSWIPQCAANETGCRGTWSTEEPVQNLDSFGWVTALPKPEDPEEYTRVSTLLFREIEGQYPGGRYIVLYDGEGTLEYQFDAKKVESESGPGRDVLEVTPSGLGILLSITATDPNQTGDYIRNIHVVPEAYEETFATEIFNPIFLERINSFAVLRFMDWMDTNHSKQREWADRPTPESATFAGRGVPVEWMVELANRLGVPPWFCMPHQATDDYIENVARLVKEQLDPSLDVYIEFSNEVWNWGFEQAHYALQQGQERWGEDKGDAFMQWYGMRAAQMSDIWNDIFADQRDRVISVMATQTAWLGLENSALDCPLWVAEGNAPCFQHHIDAYAITGYFSGSLMQERHRETVLSWLQEPDGGFSKAIAQIQQGDSLTVDGNYDDSLPGLSESFAYHHKVAQDRNLRLFAYEGGQHLALPDHEQISTFFIELNRRPEMYDLYTDLLDRWAAAGGELFMNFTDIGQPSKWGSWGLLESVQQESSPKYDAVITWIEQHPPSSGAAAAQNHSPSA
jgi:hypothetical protein